MAEKNRNSFSLSSFRIKKKAKTKKDRKSSEKNETNDDKKGTVSADEVNDITDEQDIQVFKNTVEEDCTLENADVAPTTEVSEQEQYVKQKKKAKQRDSESLKKKVKEKKLAIECENSTDAISEHNDSVDSIPVRTSSEKKKKKSGTMRKLLDKLKGKSKGKTTKDGTSEESSNKTHQIERDKRRSRSTGELQPKQRPTFEETRKRFTTSAHINLSNQGPNNSALGSIEKGKVSKLRGAFEPQTSGHSSQHSSVGSLNSRHSRGDSTPSSARSSYGRPQCPALEVYETTPDQLRKSCQSLYSQKSGSSVSSLASRGSSSSLMSKQQASAQTCSSQYKRSKSGTSLSSLGSHKSETLSSHLQNQTPFKQTDLSNNTKTVNKSELGKSLPDEQSSKAEELPLKQTRTIEVRETKDKPAAFKENKPSTDPSSSKDSHGSRVGEDKGTNKTPCPQIKGPIVGSAAPMNVKKPKFYAPECEQKVSVQGHSHIEIENPLPGGATAAQAGPTVIHYHLTIQNCDGLEIHVDPNTSSLTRTGELIPKTVFSSNGQKLKRLSWIEQAPVPLSLMNSPVRSIGYPTEMTTSTPKEGMTPAHSELGLENSVMLSEEGERYFADDDNDTIIMEEPIDPERLSLLESDLSFTSDVTLNTSSPDVTLTEEHFDMLGHISDTSLDTQGNTSSYTPDGADEAMVSFYSDSELPSLPRSLGKRKGQLSNLQIEQYMRNSHDPHAINATQKGQGQGRFSGCSSDGHQTPTPDNPEPNSGHAFGHGLPTVVQPVKSSQRDRPSDSHEQQHTQNASTRRENISREIVHGSSASGGQPTSRPMTSTADLVLNRDSFFSNGNELRSTETSPSRMTSHIVTAVSVARPHATIASSHTHHSEAAPTHSSHTRTSTLLDSHNNSENQQDISESQPEARNNLPDTQPQEGAVCLPAGSTNGAFEIVSDSSSEKSDVGKPKRKPVKKLPEKKTAEVAKVKPVGRVQPCVRPQQQNPRPAASARPPTLTINVTHQTSYLSPGTPSDLNDSDEDLLTTLLMLNEVTEMALDGEELSSISEQNSLGDISDLTISRSPSPNPEPRQDNESPLHRYDGNHSRSIPSSNESHIQVSLSGNGTGFVQTAPRVSVIQGFNSPRVSQATEQTFSNRTQRPVTTGIGRVAQPASRPLVSGNVSHLQASGVVSQTDSRQPMNSQTQRSVPHSQPLSNQIQRSVPHSQPMNNQIQRPVPHSQPINSQMQRPMPQSQRLTRTLTTQHQEPIHVPPTSQQSQPTVRRDLTRNNPTQRTTIQPRGQPPSSIASQPLPSQLLLQAMSNFYNGANQQTVTNNQSNTNAQPIVSTETRAEQQVEPQLQRPQHNIGRSEPLQTRRVSTQPSNNPQREPGRENVYDKLTRIREDLIRVPGVLLVGMRRGRIAVTLNPDRRNLEEVIRFMRLHEVQAGEYECGVLARQMRPNRMTGTGTNLPCAVR